MRGIIRRLAAVLVALTTVGSYAGNAYADNLNSGVDGKVTPDCLTQSERDNVLYSLFEADIEDVTFAIKSGMVTATDVTKFYLDRIDAYNESYNCFITLLRDEALLRAAELDERVAKGDTEGALFGAPVVVKDNIDMAGVYTTNGLFLDRGAYMAEADAYVVKRLKEEGAIILGKANMSTEASSARVSYSNIQGEVLNAYNTKLSAGGSSGGSAVSVALNFCLAGLGTDTNSSLRIPASFNNCVAMRSTFGLVDRTGTIEVNSKRDVVGAITRTVKDNALMLDVLADNGENYAGNLNASNVAGKRLGVLKTLTEQYGADGEITAAFENVKAVYTSLGAEVVEVSLATIFDYVEDCAYGDEEMLKRFKAEFDALMLIDDLDAIIFPTFLSSPLLAGFFKGDFAANSQVWINNSASLSSIIGVPEITVPMGFHSLGSGIGFEIVGKDFDEQLLFDLAYAYELNNNKRVAPKEAPNLVKGETVDVFAVYNDVCAKLSATKTGKESNAKPQKDGSVTDVPAADSPADNPGAKENSGTVSTGRKVIFGIGATGFALFAIYYIRLQNSRHKKSKKGRYRER